MVEILREQFFSVLGREPSLNVIYCLIIAAVVVATTVHEFGHAWMADRLGDDTPRSQGRVTLNPVAHLDPLGTLLFIATMFIGFPIGWGKPVKTKPENFKVGARPGMAYVALAGPVMNLVTAIVLAPIARFIIAGGFGYGELAQYILIFLAITIMVNLALFCFNLVPVHPLDGSHIAANLLPESLAKPYRYFMQRYGVYLLLLLMYNGTLGRFLAPIILALFRMLIGL
jgi:Zn-dependent protease